MNPLPNRLVNRLLVLRLILVYWLSKSVTTKIIDLFARGASPAEVAAFHPSEEVQERVRYLLERNSAGELTEEEAAELDRLGELEHFMQLVKIRAQEYLKKKT